MYGFGKAKPEYIKSDAMTIDPGAKAWAKVREVAAIVLNTMDMTIVTKNEASMKKKKCPVSRRRFAIKYKGMLKVKVLRIL